MNAKEIKAAVDSGVSINELARRTGINRSTLASRFNRAGYSSTALRLATIRAEGIELMAQGLTRKEAARRLGISAGRLSRAVPEYPVLPHVKLTPDALCEVERLLDKGVPIYIIAERLGVTRDAIYKAIR